MKEVSNLKELLKEYQIIDIYDIADELRCGARGLNVEVKKDEKGEYYIYAKRTLESIINKNKGNE
jgi:hypothetical protein